MTTPSQAQVIPLLDLPQLSQAPSTKDVHKTLADFDILSVLGRGSYGRVLLVRRIKTGELLAMKVMTKRDIVERRVLDNIKAERQVLEHINHPYLVSLRYAFQTHEKLYLLMTYQPGGEMFTKLERDGPFVEYHARFYLAEVLVAINYLHTKGIIYRDLKPENVLFQSDGHIALTDFGFAKKFANEADEKTQSFCGSLQYLAPEIVRKEEYGREVDIWCCGVFLYELLTQRTPFQSDNRNEMLKNITTKEPKYHKTWSKPLVNLLKGLLEKDSKKRLTFEQIKKHPYFETTDWREVEAKKTFPPYKPTLKSDVDVSLFDVRFTQEVLDETPSNAAQNDAFRHSSLATLPQLPPSLQNQPQSQSQSNPNPQSNGVQPVQTQSTVNSATTTGNQTSTTLTTGPTTTLPHGSASPLNNASHDREGLRHHRKGETPVFGPNNSKSNNHLSNNSSSISLNLPPPPQFSLGKGQNNTDDPDLDGDGEGEEKDYIPELNGGVGSGIGGVVGRGVVGGGVVGSGELVTVLTLGSVNLGSIGPDSDQIPDKITFRNSIRDHHHGNGDDMGDKVTFRSSIRAKMNSSLNPTLTSSINTNNHHNGLNGSQNGANSGVRTEKEKF